MVFVQVVAVADTCFSGGGSVVYPKWPRERGRENEKKGGQRIL